MGTAMTGLFSVVNKSREMRFVQCNQVRYAIRVARFIAVLVGLIDFYLTRFVVFSDGISYLEVARRYADGDLRGAVNAYWSPLYSWVLAIARLVCGANDGYELVSLHAINLAAYLLALFLFDRLVQRLLARRDNWTEQGKVTFVVCAYSVFVWCAYYMIGIYYCSPDMIVFALTILLALLLLRLDEGGTRWSTMVSLGTVLALGYFAKAALLPLSGIYILSATLRRPVVLSLLRRSLVPTVTLLLLATPWILALRAKEGRWTFGDSGTLNYAWEVCGAARSVHWQGEPGDIGTPLHPTRLIHREPDVYEFNGPIAATYPPWFDPTYWYAGVKPRLELGRQLAVAGTYLRFAGLLLLFAPGVFLSVLAVYYGSSIARAARASAAAWRLAVPCLATIALYSLVYIDTRYVAGSLLVLSLVVLSCTLPWVVSRRWLAVVRYGAAVTCLLFCSLLPLRVVYKFTHPQAPGYTDQQSRIAEEMRDLGLRRGDSIAYIGISANAYWALLSGVTISAEIPVSFDRNGRIDNYVLDNYSNLERFWGASPVERDSVLALLHDVGVRAVVADVVPAGADVTGWHRMRGQAASQRGPEGVFVRFLR